MGVLLKRTQQPVGGAKRGSLRPLASASNYPGAVSKPRVTPRMRREAGSLAERLLAAVDRGELSAPDRLVRLLKVVRDRGSSQGAQGSNRP